MRYLLYNPPYIPSFVTKITLTLSIAVSLGGVGLVSALGAILLFGGLTMKPCNVFSVWFGAAFLWRPLTVRTPERETELTSDL